MKELELSSWTEFKTTVIDNKNLNCQYTDKGGYYDLYGPDAGMILWHYRLKQDGGSDHNDFEQNYKINFNFAIGFRSYPFATGDFDFAGDANFTPVTILKGTSANLDYKLPQALYTDGGEIITEGAVFGDWAELQIIDIDNVLGFGVDTILKKWVNKRYINPVSQQSTLKTPYAGHIMAGLYLRAVVHSTGTVNDVKAVFNLDLHKGI